MPINTKATYAGVAILLIVLSGGLWWRHHHQSTDDKTVGSYVNTMQVKQGPLNFTIKAVGTIESLQIAKISSQVPGFVQAIYFQDGKSVQANDLLIQLNNEEALAAVQSADAALKLSASNYQRESFLVKQKFGSAAQLESLSADLKAKQAAFDIAKSTLEKKAIRAPFAGVLTDKKISVGDYVEAGLLLVELVDNHRLVVSYYLPEKDLAYIQLGQAVKISSELLADQAVTARVTYIAPVIDSDTRTVHIQALLDPTAHVVRPGMFVTVTESLATQDAIFIPEQAVLASADGYYVWTVTTDGHAKKQQIKIGKRLFGKVQIMNGLQDNQQVVIAGQDGLEEGSSVNVISTKGS